MTGQGSSSLVDERYAYHEAGHCVMARLVGGNPSSVWINSANPEKLDVANGCAATFPTIEAEIQYLLAGEIGEEFAPNANPVEAFYHTQGKDGDEQRARELAGDLGHDPPKYLTEKIPKVRAALQPHGKLITSLAGKLVKCNLIANAELHKLLASIPAGQGRTTAAQPQKSAQGGQAMSQERYEGQCNCTIMRVNYVGQGESSKEGAPTGLFTYTCRNGEHPDGEAEVPLSELTTAEANAWNAGQRGDTPKFDPAK